MGNFPFSRPGSKGCSGLCCLFLPPCQRRWMVLWHSLAACKPSTVASQWCWGWFLADQGGCDLLWGGGTHSSCNPQVWKDARDVPRAACSHPVWAEPRRWAQGTCWGAQPYPAEPRLQFMFSFRPALWSISSPPPATANSSTPLTSRPAHLGVIQVLFSLRNCDANVLQEPSTV